MQLTPATNSPETSAPQAATTTPPLPDEEMPMPLGRFGVGFNLGLPSDLTLKYYLKPRQALAFTAGIFPGAIMGAVNYTMYTLSYNYHFNPEKTPVWRSIPFVKKFTPYLGLIYVYGRSQRSGVNVYGLGLNVGGDWRLKERLGVFFELSGGYGPGLTYSLFTLGRAGMRYYF